MLINKKDIIAINKEIGSNGQFSNESSLEFALSIVMQKKDWMFELSYIVRSLLVDHVFQDGNKRTATAIIATYIKDNNMDYDKQRIFETVLQISKKNINDINKIVRMMKNVIVS